MADWSERKGKWVIFCHCWIVVTLVAVELPWWLTWRRICLPCRRPSFGPWVGKIPWQREQLPTPVFLPGESHGQRSLAGHSPWITKSQTEWLTHRHTQCLFKVLNGNRSGQWPIDMGPMLEGNPCCQETNVMFKILKKKSWSQVTENKNSSTNNAKVHLAEFCYSWLELASSSPFRSHKIPALYK